MALLTIEETGTSGPTSIRVEQTATHYLPNSFNYSAFIGGTGTAPDGIFWLAIGI